MRDDRRDLNAAGVDELYGAQVRIRVDERALDGELFLVDVEKRHFVGRFHLRHAEEQDRSV